MIYLHGCGFQGGDKFGDYGGASIKLLLEFVELGFTAISINYRLVKHQPIIPDEFLALSMNLQNELLRRYCKSCGCRSGSSSKLVNRLFAKKNSVACRQGAREFSDGPTPISIEEYQQGVLTGEFSNAIAAAVEDGIAAINWAKRNEKLYNIDSGQIVLMGSSAGAIAANLMAYVADDLVPNYDLKLRGVVSISGEILGGEKFIDKDDPPIFLVHSAKDPYVSVESADLMKSQMSVLGLYSPYARLEGTGHSLASISFYKTKWQGRFIAQELMEFVLRATQ